MKKNIIKGLTKPFALPFNLATKLTVLLLSISIFSVQANGYGQNVEITLNVEQIGMGQALKEIEALTDFKFLYSNYKIDDSILVSIKAVDKPLYKVLDHLFEGTTISYVLRKKQIVLKVDSPKNSSLPIAEDTATLEKSIQLAISGTITDHDGLPLSGANIVEKGTTNGVIADFDGDFTIDVVDGNAVLVISYIGFATKEVEVDGQLNLNIELEEAAAGLDEVVVIGYGTQLKSNISAAVASVDVAKMDKVAATGVQDALEGMVAGLSVNALDGSPGSNPEIVIRGLTSYGTGENSALTIIDGVPGDISTINSSDIKSIDILKDASAAAIYGSRAAAGVILITTKRGSNQEPRIDFNSFYSYERLAKTKSVLNSADYIRINKLAHNNAGNATYPNYVNAYETDPSQFADTDWQNAYFESGFVQKNDVRFSGGSDWMNVSFSAFNSTNQGIMVGTDSKQYGVRLNSDMDINSKVKVGQSFNYSSKKVRPEEASGFPGMFQATNIQPLIPVYDDTMEGGYGGAIPGMGMTDASNPVGTNHLRNTENTYSDLNMSFFAEYSPIEDLKLKALYGLNKKNEQFYNYTPTYRMGAYDFNDKASLSDDRLNSENTLLEFTANYNKVIGEHNISILAGYTEEEYTYDLLQGSVENFPSNESISPGNGMENDNVSGELDRWGLRSYLSRISYGYSNRYLLMASLRSDGSSKFGDNNKWGYFPSASVAWRVINEPFMESLKPDFSEIKLRMSYGVLGNQAIGTYKYIPEISSDNNSLNYVFGMVPVNYLGYAITSLASSNIKWETTQTKNLGLDVSILNNKLSFSADVFWKKTFDMLTAKPISSSTGISSPPIVNEGEMETKGWEFNTIYNTVGKNGMNFSATLNLSHYKSTLTKMGDEGYEEWFGPSKTYVGGEIGEFWVYKSAGIFQSQAEVDTWNAENGYTNESNEWIAMQPNAQPGDIRFLDVEKDGILDNSDRVKVGTGTPDVVTSLNLSFSWKNFDVAAYFYGEFGGLRFNYGERQLTRMDNNFNYGSDALKSWTPDNMDTNVPRAVIGDPNGNIRLSDRYVESGDFVRLNNLQIGYSLPKSLLDKAGIDRLRVYIGGKRLLTFTNYSGYDPGSVGGSMTNRGVDNALYPLTQSFVIGTQLSF